VSEANAGKEQEKDEMGATIEDLQPSLEVSVEDADNIAGGRATVKGPSTSNGGETGGVDFD
jgi:hypothetical protein